MHRAGHRIPENAFIQALPKSAVFDPTDDFAGVATALTLPQQLALGQPALNYSLTKPVRPLNKASAYGRATPRQQMAWI